MKVDSPTLPKLNSASPKIEYGPASLENDVLSERESSATPVELRGPSDPGLTLPAGIVPNSGITIGDPLCGFT
jgi:hypothetical protein